MNKKFHLGVIILVLILFYFCPGAQALASPQIIIDKKTNQLHYFKDGKLLRTFPVATGRHPSFTPEGNFTVVVKLVNPYYSKLGIPGGSPENPLGVRWLGLSIGGGGVYGIHGTNNPASIGTYASAGCIRMHNRDVIWLYDNTPLGTPVKITSSGAITVPAVPKTVMKEIYIVANGRGLTVKSPGTGRDGAPLLPVRPVFEMLGYTIWWEPATSTIHLYNDDHVVTVSCTTGEVTTGEETFPVPGINILNGTAYGPLELWRKVLPAMEVNWEQDVQTVSFNRQTGVSQHPGPIAAPPGTREP